MKVEINMINVEDGDAIILMLEKENRKALVVIDGGVKKHYDKLKRRLEEVLPFYNNTISLVICTHYDNDHLGGIGCLLDDYHKIVQQIWIHKIESTLNEQSSLMQTRLGVLENKYLTIEKIQEYANVKSLNSTLVVEGYRELISLIKKLNRYGLESKIKEPFRGDFLEGFEEFVVVSPSRAYYESYLGELKTEAFVDDVEENVFKTTNLLVEDNYTGGVRSMRKFSDLMQPCEKLESSSVANNVTATNMVSIVTLLKVDNKKYLFTADAGIETFESQHLLENEELKDLEWLELPHHGSKNNTSKRMLSHFDPKIVFVSADGGENRPHYLINACLGQKRAGNKVYVTNDPVNTWYIKYDGSEFARIYV
ncbi:MBL fold metallo-hydrolase [Rufibacter immobilis]|uniref:MBL fold metallo-hydrolase n=1 Tax=Rufibacter immobilis TaxID=1348778 RepID=UPI0035E5F67F